LRIEIEKSSLPKQAKALLALQNSLGSTKIEQVLQAIYFGHKVLKNCSNASKKKVLH
jgi:hypothetical protein